MKQTMNASSDTQGHDYFLIIGISKLKISEAKFVNKKNLVNQIIAKL